MYAQATMEINIKGTQVIPVPLFEVLDGKREVDYVERVEPSTEGGRKMSEKLRDVVLSVLDERSEKDSREDSLTKDGREEP